MFKVTLPNDLEKLTELTHQLEAFVESNGVGPKTAYCLNLAVEELFVNFVRHGAAKDGSLELTLTHEDGVLQVHLEDEGPSFNPLEAPEPNVDAALDERNVGGLGLHLIKEMSDEVSYQRISGRNVVDLRLGLR